MGTKTGVSEQVLSLPRGGGALKGIGEKFSPDLHTGVGQFSIPLTVLPGRNSFQPTLQLTYSSGGGNSAFGQGWSLSIPGIARRTSKGVPTYNDDTDIFVLAGFEDLVPIRVDGNSTYYRPRVEATFARIRHVRDAKNNYWEVRTRDGLTSTYGQPGVLDHASVLRDPNVDARVFAWKLTQTRDPFGNRIEYGYARDPVRVDGPHHWDQSYLTSIRYLDVDRGSGVEFLASVSLEYDVRPDPFSDYAAGFEVRTVRRAQVIRVSSHVDRTREVRRYELTYADQLADRAGELATNGVSQLARVHVIGVDDEASPATQALPPIDMHYGTFDVSRRIRHALAGSLPTGSLTNKSLDLVDLEGRGLPDFVEVTTNGIRSWRNLGRGRFDAPKAMAAAPAVDLSDKGVQLFDSDGDGRVELVISGARPDVGYYPLSLDGRWAAASSRALIGQPSFAFDDPEVRLVDLDRNGVIDVLRTGPQYLECYFHDEATGWSQKLVARQSNLDDFPDVSFSDARVRLADLSGDGLQDIVLVQGRRVSYWPNLGHGRWGRRIDMGELSQLPIGYDVSRLMFADVDGDGVADAIYLESGKLSLWINQCGNRWSTRTELTGLPALTATSDARIVDLHGTGTAGVLWSRGGTSGERYTFLALGGLPAELVPDGVTPPSGAWVKPYVLCEIDNGRGARTSVEYMPSTVFRLRDDAVPSHRWRSPLPMPVQVVSKIVTAELFNGQRLTSRYSYHHGCWDGAEREFAGFGRVDHVDADHVIAATTTPPLETRTWFHQGVISDPRHDGSPIDYSTELWADDTAGVIAEPGIDALISGSVGAVRRQVLRALRGKPRRVEVYGLDGTTAATRPYTVTDHSYGVARVVDSLGGPSGLVFTAPSAPGITPLFVIASGQRVAEWARGHEPLVRYTFHLHHDAYGQAQRTLELGLPRTAGAPFLAKLEVVSFAQRDDAAVYITDRVATQATYALPTSGSESLPELLKAALSLDAGSAVPAAAVVHFYDGDAFVGLPPAVIGGRGALVRTEVLAFASTDLIDMYGSPPSLITAGTRASDHPVELIPPTAGSGPRPGMTPCGLGYAVASPGSALPAGYYFAKERRAYDFQRGGIPRGLVEVMRDALGNDARLAYDATAHRPVTVTDALGLSMEASYDPRSLELASSTDPNGTVTRYRYSPLGQLSSVAVTSGNGLHGDDDEHPSLEYSYGLAPVAWSGGATPHYVHTRKRVDHVRTAGGSSDFVELREYSDGLGRLIQTRTLAEDDIWGDPDFGDCGMDTSGNGPLQRASQRGATDPVNVVVSGWSVLDAKGHPRAKYEPTYATGWQFDDQSSPSARKGERVELSYDALGRGVRTTEPDGTFTQTVHGRPAALATPDVFAPNAWDLYTYDQNDNSSRANGGQVLPGWVASHVDTPSSVERDAWGRKIRSVSRLDQDPAHDLVTTSRHDIFGNVIEIVDPLKRVAFRFAYDRAQRRIRTTSLDGGTVTLILDARGNDTERRDAKGALTVRSFDAVHRPIRVWGRDAAAEPITLRERVVYGDALANRPAALATWSLGRLSAHYDEAGCLFVDAYDFRGRVLENRRRIIDVKELLSVFSSTGPASAYRVDWTPRPGQTFDTRAATILEAGTGHESSFQYDALDRIVARTYPRDQAGKRRTGHARYNRAGALEQLLFDGATYVDKIGYTARGERSFIALTNGLLTRYLYDRKTSKLVRLRTEKISFQDGTYKPTTASPVQNIRYGYDCSGNLVYALEQTKSCGVKGAPSLRRDFEYDATYRLVLASGRKAKMSGSMWTVKPRGHDPKQTTKYIEQYTYDAAGNLRGFKAAGGSRTIKPVGGVDASGASVDSNRVEVATIGTGAAATKVAYVFDAAGSLSQESSSRRFAWDHRDRLRSFEDRAGSVASKFATYLYDAAGLRIAKVTRNQGGGCSITTYIDDVFESYKEQSGTAISSAHTICHLVDKRARVASLRTGKARTGDKSPSIQYTLTDHLGSVAVTATAAGKEFRREEYTPYGETSFGGSSGKRYRFTGMERDEEHGLAYHRARYYLPWLGSWASLDPLAAEPGIQTYAYARGTPLTHVDQTGLAPIPNYTAGKANEALHEAAVGQFSAQDGHVDVTTQRALRNTNGGAAQVPKSTTSTASGRTIPDLQLKCKVTGVILLDEYSTDPSGKLNSPQVKVSRAAAVNNPGIQGGAIKGQLIGGLFDPAAPFARFTPAGNPTSVVSALQSARLSALMEVRASPTLLGAATLTQPSAPPSSWNAWLSPMTSATNLFSNALMYIWTPIFQGYTLENYGVVFGGVWDAEKAVKTGILSEGQPVIYRDLEGVWQNGQFAPKDL
jgi:RHS repeat-associated protein